MCQETFDWDTRINFFKLNYNMSKHRATGYEPAVLFFGRKLKTPFLDCNDRNKETPSQYISKIKEHMHQARANALLNMKKISEEYNRNKSINHKELEIGDEVYLKSLRKNRKLGKRFDGPFFIERKFRNSNYLIREKEGNRSLKIHISKIFKVPPEKEN